MQKNRKASFSPKTTPLTTHPLVKVERTGPRTLTSEDKHAHTHNLDCNPIYEASGGAWEILLHCELSPPPVYTHASWNWLEDKSSPCTLK